LASTGTPAFFIHPTEALHGDLGMITQADVIIALSHSGESKELAAILAYAGRFGIPLIALTGKNESTLAKAATVVLNTRVVREACPLNRAPTTSTTAALALADGLAVALMHERGFTQADFAAFHPGGKLGAMLKHTSDFMHTGEAVPLKPLGTKMSEAVLEMSAKGFGCVAIVDARGHVAGIITDGDLRRHMRRPDLMDALVDEVMTGNPKTIASNTLAGEALKLMSSKISTLIVTDADKPVGIVHLHDLLRAGVA
jgi:arabinose-5-phosphate isomerase